MKANSVERAEFAETIARQIRQCKSQKEAIRIAAAVVYALAAPQSINKAEESFGIALCDMYKS